MSLRILCVAPPYSGHLHPLLGLATGLQRHGHVCTVATGVAQADLVRSVGLAARPVLEHDPQAFARISDTPGPVGSHPVRLARQLRANLALQPAVLGELDAIVRRERPDVIVADFTAAVAGLVAERHALPWVTTMPTPFALETRTGTPSYCGGWSPPRHAGHRLRDATGRAVTRAFKHTMQHVFARELDAVGARVYRPDGTEAAYSPQAILALGAPQVEFARDWPACLQLAGPVLDDIGPGRGIDDDPALTAAVAAGAVLVTAGTHLPWARRELVRDTLALAGARPDVTFVVTLGRQDRWREPARRIAPGVLVVPYLPYRASVGRFRAVVHHGGAGISYQAVAAGVPSLVLPRDYDQFDFAARLSACGAATVVRRLNGPGAVRALAALLARDPGPLRLLGRDVAALDPVAALDRTVRRLAG